MCMGLKCQLSTVIKYKPINCQIEASILVNTLGKVPTQIFKNPRLKNLIKIYIPYI